MTNSTPKPSNKIVRQGSPSSQGKNRRSASYVKTVTYFSTPNAGRNNNNNINNSTNKSAANANGRQSCSPPFGKSANNTPARSSPMRFDNSPRSSPTNNSFYAGAKFSEPPSPASLPKPPSHWTGLMVSCQSEMAAFRVAEPMKMFVNVQA